MNIAKVCFICLNENKQNLISIFSCIRELHPQLNSMREQLQKTRKIENNWSRIDDLRIIEILDNCFPQQIASLAALSNKMCVLCMEDLISAHFFRLRCQNAVCRMENVLPDSIELPFNKLKDDIGDFLNVIIKSETADDEEVQAAIGNEIENHSNNEAMQNISHENVHISDTEANDTEEFVNVFQILEDSDNEDQSLTEAETGVHESEGSDDDIYSENPNQKQQTCKYCFRKFASFLEYTAHVATHKTSGVDEKPKLLKINQCQECGKIFKKRYRLTYHMRTHDNPKSEKVCPHCGYSFVNIQNHVAKCKENKAKNALNELKKFVCEICSKAFGKASYLRKHLDRHNRTSFDCKICGEKFTEMKDFTTHSRTHSSLRHLCSDCGRSYPTRHSLLVHTRIHTGERPYKCKFCVKAFTRLDSLKCHEQHHTGERTHACSVCHKSFFRANHLNLHTRTHTGERPYKCQHCDRAFAQKTDYITHLRRRHTGERFKCDICHDAFIQLYLLNRHKRVKHGIDIVPNNARIKSIESSTAHPTDREKDEIS